MADTRKDRRAPVSLKVRFKSATVDEFIEQYSKDVSRGGIFIKSSQPMAVGTLLKFQFQLKDESALIRGVGRVVWTRAEEHAGAERPAGMGIKFIKMDPESKATVDRIIDAHGDVPGAYESGRKTATHAEAESLRPPPENGGGGGGAFFPETTPMAELPPPEDRTAVRHAAQFLASALSGAGTDEAAAREAEQKAEEARKRTAQIEAERAAEAERRKKAQVQGEQLPSMIIDPSLDAHAPLIEPPPAPRAPVAEVPTQASRPSKPPQESRPSKPPGGRKSKPPQGGRNSKPPPAARAAAASAPSLGSEDDTSITDRKQVSAKVQGSTPPAAEPAKKPWLIPALVIGVVVVVAALLALRADEQAVPSVELEPAPAQVAPPEPAAQPAPTPAPEPAPAEPTPSEAQPADPAVAQPEPSEPAPAEPAAQEPAPAEPVAEPTPAPTPAPEPSVTPGAQPAASKLGKVRVVTLPAGAVVLINDKQRGKSPLMIDLPKGVTHTITARAPGYVDGSQLVTPGAQISIATIRLEPMEYVLRVETNPSGATVSVSGKRGTSPVEMVIGPPPKAGLPITARLVGYEMATGKVTPGDFSPTDRSMRATVKLSLEPFSEAPREPRPAPAPKPEAPKPEAPAETAPAPQPEAPKPAPVEPKPAAPKPEAPAEPIPDNPFG